MTFINTSRARHYAAAVLAVAVATAVRLALDPVMGKQDVLFAFVLAIVSATLTGGRGPGLLATVLSVPVALYFSVEPQFSFAVDDPADVVRLVVLAATGVAISLFAKPVQRRSAPWVGAKSGFRGPAFLRSVGLIGGACAALALLTSLLFRDFERERDRHAWVSHTYQVLDEIKAVTLSLEQAETGQRNFLLTGDERYLDSFETTRQGVRSGVRILKGLTADNPVQVDRLGELGRLIESKLSLLQTTEALRQKRGNAATLAIQLRQGKDLTDRCRSLMEAMQAEERRLLADRTQAAELQAKRMRWILGLGSASLLMLLILAGAMIERDIAERRRAEQTSELLSSIVTSSDDAIFSRDLNGMILSWNKGAERLTGYSASEAIGQPLPHFFPADGAEDYSQVVERLRAGETGIHVESKRVRKDGEAIDVSVKISPLKLEGLIAGASIIARDITERRKAEQALALSEERYRSLVVASNQIVWAIPPDGMVEDMPLWRDFSGQSVEEVKGWGWLDALHPDDRERTVEIWLRAVHNRCFYDTEYRIRRKDGQYRDMAVHGVPVFDKAGNIREWVGSCADITDRKAAEEALRASRAQLEAALASMTDALCITDANGQFVHFNDAFVTYQRFPNKNECLRDLADYPAILDVFFPDGTLAPLDTWAAPRALRGETVKEAEYILRRKDTGETWVGSYSFGPIRDKDGLIVGSVVVCRDITDRKQAEKTLLESEQRFRTLANAIPQLCWIANPDGAIYWYNQRWYEYTGATPEQMEAQGWQSVHDAKALPGVLLRWKESIASGEPFEMVFPLRAGDGTFHPFLTRVMPLRDPNGKVVQWFGTNTDITKQQKAQEEIMEISENRRLALEAGSLGAWDYQFQTGKVFWDQRCRDMFGLSEGDQDDYDTAISRIHADDRPAVDEALKRALAGANGGAYHPEFRVIWPDGSVHWLLSHGRVYFDSSEGQSIAVRFLGLNVDVTDQKRAEEKVCQLNRELEARVVERTAQWEAANKELEAFAYSVSHDLRAPLRAIDGFSRIVSEEHAQELPAEAQRCLNIVRKNTLRMGALIDDLLAFSRLGRQPLQKRMVDVSDLARLVFDELRGEQKSPGEENARCIEIAIARMPLCEADPALLKQVLVNLLSNALKYTRPRNPAKIEIGAMPAEAAAGEGATVYFVRDNGIGFDMQYAGKLFGVFERLHLSEEYEGTGVGLALVQRIIARHGGRVWAEAEVDQGATFYFTAEASRALGAR